MLIATLVVGLVCFLSFGGLYLWSAPFQGARLAKRLGLPRPAVIAHRGASYLAPENTRPAYLLARELGADYLEVDLQRTRDGVLIALHDATLLRTTNIRDVFPDRADDPIETFTFSEIQRLDAGGWFNARFPDRARPSFTGIMIPRLEEILDLGEEGASRIGLFIETKAAGRHPGIERDLVEILRARGWIGADGAGKPPRIVFESFEPESLVRLKALAPLVPAVLLINEATMSRDGREALLRKAAELGAGIGTWGYRWSRDPGWSVRHAPRRYVTTWPWHTGAAHRAGLLVYPWTIDDCWEMWMLRLSGADGLFTDRPELALPFHGRPIPKDLAALWRRIGS